RFNYGPEHLALIQRHTADVKAQAQMVCTLRRADEGVSPLPPKRLRPSRSVMSRFGHQKMSSTKASVFRWRRGDENKEAFRELTPEREGGDGMSPAVLTTQSGMNRYVVQGMLERAVQLGWKGVVAEGSKAFKKLVEMIRTAWLDGFHIQD